MSKKIILLIGAPGSGKTTDAQTMAKNHPETITSFSTGELIQKEIESGSAIGNIEKSFVEHGDLVPTGIVLDMVIDAIKKAPTLLVAIDGFPRKEKQLAYFCDFIFNHNDLEVISVIEVRVGEETARGRFLAAGHSEEVFEHEMRDYLASVEDIEAHFAERGILKIIDGEQSLEQVTEEIEAHLATLI